MSTPKIFYNNSTKKWNLILKSGLSGAICFGDCSGSSGGGSSGGSSGGGSGGGSGGSNGSCTGSLPCGDTGVFGGGRNKSVFSVIDYITISTPSNATYFGNLTKARSYLAANSNGTNDRGVFNGGFLGYAIDYITISTPSNATLFNASPEKITSISATSNGTNDRGVFAGGAPVTLFGTETVNTIDYITISTPSSATDFGDLTVGRISLAATSNGTNNRGVFGGGSDGSSNLNTIDYITISTPSNAIDFGDLTVAKSSLAATSNGTNDRGVFGGGGSGDSSTNQTNTIDYITISTLSNATDFGDLTVARYYLAANSNGTNNRGVFGGGGYDNDTSSIFNTIDYITISTPSNAIDFGDLTETRFALAATSNA